MGNWTNRYYYYDTEEISHLSDNVSAIIEARNDDHEWDSDYVGNSPLTLAGARNYLRDLTVDPTWNDWELRIVIEIDNCYCGVI